MGIFIEVIGLRGKDTKESLVREFLNIMGNHDAKVDSLIRRMTAYMSDNPDRELEFMLITMQVCKESYKSNNFELCIQMASPVFEKVMNINNGGIQPLSFLELTILATIIEFSPNFKVARDLAKKILALLDTEYSHEKMCNVAREMVSHNILPVLLRAKCYKSEGNRAEVQSLFDENLKKARLANERAKRHAYLAWLQIQEGIFYVDTELVDQGITWLKENERKTWYPSAVDELLTYYRHLGDEITKSQLDILVGYRIRKIRESQEIHIEEAAEFIGLTDNALEQIESGRRGAKGIHLYKLSHLFKVDISYFYYGEKCE